MTLKLSSQISHLNFLFQNMKKENKFQMNLFSFFRIKKKYPKDIQIQPTIFITTDRITKEKVEVDHLERSTLIKTRSVNGQHWPTFSTRCSEKLGCRTSCKKPLPTRVSICITEARVTMEIGLQVV